MSVSNSSSSSLVPAPLVRIHPLNEDHYTFGVKNAIKEKDATIESRTFRLGSKFQTEGMRRSVEAVLIVHQHGHPHLLLLQNSHAVFRLPGGKLAPGEDDIDGLQRKLNKLLVPDKVAQPPVWEIVDQLSTWWRPGFEPFEYPYLPVHASKPKECKKVFLVSLPEKCVFAIPQNLKLLAVPLFEVYNNQNRYGSIIASLPQTLSRFQFSFE